MEVLTKGAICGSLGMAHPFSGLSFSIGQIKELEHGGLTGPAALTHSSDPLLRTTFLGGHRELEPLWFQLL